MKYSVIYNPFACNGKGKDNALKIKSIITDSEIDFVDITTITSYVDYFNSLDSDSAVVISGGDGTINRFINETLDVDYNRDIFYYGAGTGNDFLRDIEKSSNELVNISQYIINLPVAEIKGKKYKFLNGIGFGIDGYCCEVGDKQRETNPGADINYTSIAIKGLLFGFKRVNATIEVDGASYTFKNVWLAPTMNGRCYGGGMFATPSQNRLNENGTVSTMVMNCASKIKTLIIFPSIFKGEHIKHSDIVHVFEGHNIHVLFDKPTALQVDGETILDVTEYTISASIDSRKSRQL